MADQMNMGDSMKWRAAREAPLEHIERDLLKLGFIYDEYGQMREEKGEE